MYIKISITFNINYNIQLEQLIKTAKFAST